MAAVPRALLNFGRWQREGERGRAWIDALPDLLDELLARWDLTPDGAAMNGYNGVVLPVLRERRSGSASGSEAGSDREPFVLKVSWPDESAAGREVLALVTWDGRGAVRLLDSSPAEGALLLERADSRAPLSSVPLATAIPAAARLLRRLAVPAPPGPRQLADVAAEIRDGVRAWWQALGRPFPEPVVDEVRDLAGALSRRVGTLLVNHDLHYDNVLAAQRESWLAVDPKVFVGDPEYQVAQLLWCRLDEMDGRAELLARFHALVEAAGLDPELARAWIVVRCADYLLWGMDAGFTEDPRRCAALIEAFSLARAGRPGLDGGRSTLLQYPE